jgi:hypothetical protein
VTTLRGDARRPRGYLTLECSCAWVACDADGCDAAVTEPDRSDAGDAVVLAAEEGWACGERDLCDEHAGAGR